MFTTRKLGRLAVPVLVTIAFQTLVAGASAGVPSTPGPSHRSAAKSTARPAAKAAPAPVPKSPVTISITSRMRQGNLVVSLDGVPVFNEKFQKPLLIISQTTTWDPVQVAAGKHKLTAAVHGENGKTYLSGTYDLEVSRTGGIELRIRMKGDRLTVERTS